MDNQDTLGAFYSLADRWLELSAQAIERASKAKKGSPFALYETITGEILTTSSQELRASLDELRNKSLDDLSEQIKALLHEWSLRSEDAKERSAKTSLDGARHVGTALGLDMVIEQIKRVMESQNISIS